jgi:Na+-translocating ferredoxin:NAD+ oxidoreductase subunit D
MPFPTAPAPHVVAPDSVGRVIRIVLYALLPTVALHVMFFGAGLLV